MLTLMPVQSWFLPFYFHFPSLLLVQNMVFSFWPNLEIMGSMSFFFPSLKGMSQNSFLIEENVPFVQEKKKLSTSTPKEKQFENEMT